MPASSHVSLSVDPSLGYPPSYPHLCLHRPPLSFLPHPLPHYEIASLNELADLFPIIAEQERDSSLASSHAHFLWSQLDHLGNAGFDPAKFRVDPYGNVLYWSAHTSSPLAWEVDHWFPHSRGGKTIVSNLRLVQRQVARRKNEKLEFLVPWWDFQLGVSVNQFLHIVASRIADFRQRAFSLLFPQCENEPAISSDVENHSWPKEFRDKAKQLGYAVAALAKVDKEPDDTTVFQSGTKAPKHGDSVPVTPTRRKWRPEEEEALAIALQKFRPVNRFDKKSVPPAAKRFNMNQYQSISHEDLELDSNPNEDVDVRHASVAAAIQQSTELLKQRALEKQQKEEQIVRMEKELKILRTENERERAALDELEGTVAKHKKRVEKQRRWSETQSQYRQCLERILRDTMHQSIVFKEQARLNQAACNALLARLQSQKISCEKAELDLVTKSKERESLEILAQPNLVEYVCKRLIEEGPLEGSRVNHATHNKILPVDDVHRSLHEVHTLNLVEEKCVVEDPMQKQLRESTEATESLLKQSLERIKEAEMIEDEEDEKPIEVLQVNTQGSPLKRKVISGELEVTAGYINQRQKIEEAQDEIYPGRIENGVEEKEAPLMKTGEDEQLDELLQALKRQGDVNESIATASDDENEEQRVRRVGKSNVDKWLQRLLFNNAGACVTAEKDIVDGGISERDRPIVRKGDAVGAQKYEGNSTTIGNCEKSRGVLDGLLRAVSFRHEPKKLKIWKERTDAAHADVKDRELQEEKMLKLLSESEQPVQQQQEGRGTTLEKEERGTTLEKVSTASELVERLGKLQVGTREGVKEGEIFANEVDFVKRMREVREEDKMRKSGRLKMVASGTNSGGEEVPVDVQVLQVQQQQQPQLEKLHKTTKAESSEMSIPAPALDNSSLSSATQADSRKVRRSSSMRAASTGRWVLHMRKGSDDSSEAALQNDEEDVTSQPPDDARQVKHEATKMQAKGDTSSSISFSSGLGLKASIKTCTRAWKRAVSKRS